MMRFVIGCYSELKVPKHGTSWVVFCFIPKSGSWFGMGFLLDFVHGKCPQGLLVLLGMVLG